MVKSTNDPLAGKSQALKAALEAVERMGSPAGRRAARAKKPAAENPAPQPIRTARPAPDTGSADSHKSGEA